MKFVFISRKKCVAKEVFISEAFAILVIEFFAYANCSLSLHCDLGNRFLCQTEFVGHYYCCKMKRMHCVGAAHVRCRG